MRTIKHIVVHCTATGQSATIDAIKRYWKEQLGWKSPGYHYLITPDGTINQLADESEPTNGVAGHNSTSIHVSYIGGIDQRGKAIDNRTEAQKLAMIRILAELKRRYPQATIQGHRDFPGVNKACPSFDVRSWLATTGV